jgi:AraC family transcriptional regulator
MAVSVTQFDFSALIPGPSLHAPRPLSHIGLEMFCVRLPPIAGTLCAPAVVEDELILQLGGAAPLGGRVDRRFQTHVRPGTLFIVPRGTPTEWRLDIPYSVMNLYLTPLLLRQVALETMDADPARVEFVPRIAFDDRFLNAAGHALLTAVQAHGTNECLAAETLAYAITLYLLRHHTTRALPVPRLDGTLTTATLRQVIDYVHANLGRPLTLAELAAIAHLSPYHFARQFRATTGLSPYQYVLEQRLAAARQMLATRSLPLAAIAATLGFSDQSHFGSHFKRRYGVSPGALSARA